MTDGEFSLVVVLDYRRTPVQAKQARNNKSQSVEFKIKCLTRTSMEFKVSYKSARFTLQKLEGLCQESNCLCKKIKSHKEIKVTKKIKSRRRKACVLHRWMELQNLKPYNLQEKMILLKWIPSVQTKKKTNKIILAAAATPWEFPNLLWHLEPGLLHKLIHLDHCWWIHVFWIQSTCNRMYWKYMQYNKTVKCNIWWGLITLVLLIHLVDQYSSIMNTFLCIWANFYLLFIHWSHAI